MTGARERSEACAGVAADDHRNKGAGHGTHLVDYEAFSLSCFVLLRPGVMDPAGLESDALAGPAIVASGPSGFAYSVVAIAVLNNQHQDLAITDQAKSKGSNRVSRQPRSHVAPSLLRRSRRVFQVNSEVSSNALISPCCFRLLRPVGSRKASICARALQ